MRSALREPQTLSVLQDRPLKTLLWDWLRWNRRGPWLRFRGQLGVHLPLLPAQGAVSLEPQSSSLQNNSKRTLGFGHSYRQSKASGPTPTLFLLSACTSMALLQSASLKKMGAHPWQRGGRVPQESLSLVAHRMPALASSSKRGWLAGQRSSLR